MGTETWKIASLPGDGIGPEVIGETWRILHKIEALFPDLRFDREEYAIGAAEFLRSGDPFPESVFERVSGCDAILLGAMGLPDVRGPGGTEIVPQIDLRERLGLYAGVRPVHLFHPAHSPLRGLAAGAIDLVLVRESTEGLFSSRRRQWPADSDVVVDEMRITRPASVRLFHFAFALARQRRRHVTLVDKANVLPSMAFFRRIFDEISEEYPDVRTSRLYVDAAALALVRRPGDFDVIVTENMFGDILSDLAAALVGGMGVAPSADIGERHAVFQPVHGSAPDIAGKGIANPVAAILSAAMMLDWLGSQQCRRAAETVRRAVAAVLSDPARATPDLGGTLTSSALTDAILEAMEHSR
jgi:3-isopropylmalate dehydrogenase